MSGPQQRSPAAEMLQFLQSLPLLTPSDKRGVLQLIQSCLRAAEFEFDLVAATNGDVSIWRQQESRKGIYRVSGMGSVNADPKTVFELLCNTELIPEWDVLYKGARYLSIIKDAAGRCEVGYIHMVYGLPGIPTHLVADRDFVVRAVRVFFPNGMCVLFIRSVGPQEQVPGDPGPRRHRIRGHMWESGFVVVPTGPSSSCLSITLQVDPKGWIPTAVVNLSLEAMPLNISRIRAVLAHMTAAQQAQLAQLIKFQQCRCGKLPPADSLGIIDAATAAAARAVSCAAGSGLQVAADLLVPKANEAAEGAGSRHSPEEAVAVVQDMTEAGSEWFDA
eukprot:gene6458-6687_t